MAMAKRNLFDELMEGVAAMKGHRAGKITLRSYKVEPRELPEVKPKMIKQVRARLHSVARSQVPGHIRAAGAIGKIANSGRSGASTLHGR